MADCFVTLDKYKQDISRQVSRDKLLIERIEDAIKAHSECTSSDMEFNAFAREIIGWIKLPLDSWFTKKEWSNPLSVAAEYDEPIGFVTDGSKFESVHDGVQGWFEFEGER